MSIREFCNVADAAYQQELSPWTNTDGTPRAGKPGRLRNWGDVRRARDAAVGTAHKLGLYDALEPMIRRLYQALKSHGEAVGHDTTGEILRCSGEVVSALAALRDVSGVEGPAEGTRGASTGLSPEQLSIPRFLRELQVAGRQSKEWGADAERYCIWLMTWPDGVPTFLCHAEYLVPPGFTDQIEKNLTELRLRGLIEPTTIPRVPFCFSYKRRDGWEVELRKDSQERFAARVSSPDGSFVQSLGLSVQPWHDVEGFSLTPAGLAAIDAADAASVGMMRIKAREFADWLRKRARHTPAGLCLDGPAIDGVKRRRVELVDAAVVASPHLSESDRDWVEKLASVLHPQADFRRFGIAAALQSGDRSWLEAVSLDDSKLMNDPLALGDSLEALDGLAGSKDSSGHTEPNADAVASVGEPDGGHNATHSPDFTSVNWFGTRYTFSKGNQAESVRVLWEAWKDGGHSVSSDTIRQAIASAADGFELSKVFRRRKPGGGYEKNPAWGTMIQLAGKGTYRLVEP